MNRIVIKLAKDGGIERICADRPVTVMIADESCPRMYQHTPLVGSAHVEQIAGAYSAGPGKTVQSEGINKPAVARSTRPHLTVVQ